MYSRILDRTFECNKTVTVERVEGEFGFRIHGSRPVVVSAIEPGTPAQSSGLTVGDILLTINGVNVLDLPHTQVVRVAQRCSEALELGVAKTDDVTERVSIWSQLNMSQEVVAQGYLQKKKRTGDSQHHWVTRWFVLRADDCLYSYKFEDDLRPSGAVLLPGCSVKETEPGRLQISPHHGGSSIWLAATNNMAEFGEWRDMLEIAANKQRSRDDIWLDVARQRSSMPASSHRQPDCRGHLHHLQGGQWVRQLLVLLDGCLYIYSDIEPDASATGVIFLQGYKAQQSSVVGRRHAWQMTPSASDSSNVRTFFFHAQTETEKKRWLAALEYSIDRWMRLS